MRTAEQVMEENKIHKQDVQEAMEVGCAILTYRGEHHDLDKDKPENAKILAEAINTNDFDYWNELHREKKPHHFQWMNTHPTEVTLFDLMECCADGCVAYMRRDNVEHTLKDEIEFFKQNGFSDMMSTTMANTVMIFQDMVKINKE